MYGKINGFHAAINAHAQGIGDFFRALDAAEVPFLAKCVGGAATIFEAQEITKRSKVPHVIVFRQDQFPHNQGGTDTPDYTRDPREAAREQWRSHKARWPRELDPAIVYSEIINEPRKEAEWGEWIGAFCHEAASLAVADGWRLCAPGYSAGTPEPEAWERPSMLAFLRLVASRPDLLAVALHEYSFTTDHLLGDGSLVGRFTALLDACARHGLPSPPIIFTEWGWAERDVPDPETAVAHIDQANAFLANYPSVRGAAIWALDAGWGSLGQKTQRLIAPLADLLVRTRYPVVTPPALPEPAPPPALPTYRVRVHLLPNSTTAEERATVLDAAHERRETVAWSADDAGRLVAGGAPESRVIVWEPGRWDDDVVQWLWERYKARSETRLFAPPPPAPEPEPPPAPAPSPIPTVHRIGVDISHHQGAINWDRFYAPEHQVAFVYARVSDGAFLDRQFPDYWREIARRGVPYGAYQYFRNNQDPIAQADLLLRRLDEGGVGPGTLPPMIDIEDVNAPAVPERWLRWIRHVATRTGWSEEQIVIYTARWYWQRPRVPPVDWAYRHPLYAASYVSDPRSWRMPTRAQFRDLITPEDWTRKGVDVPTGWQFTSSGAEGRGVSSRGLDLGVITDPTRFSQIVRPGRPERIGLHASADGGDLPEAEFAEFAALRPGVIKVLDGTSPASVARLAREHPTAVFIVRAFLDFGGRVVSSGQFVEWTLTNVQRTVDALPGREVWVELHNEPNLVDEGLGGAWKNGAEFSTWLINVAAEYRARLRPGTARVRYLFPGLSPGGDVPGVRADSLLFLAHARSAVRALDGLAVHAYWATQEGWPLRRAVDEVRAHVMLHPDRPVWVTEASNNKPGVTPEQKASEYREFSRLVAQVGAHGVTFFVASALNPVWGWPTGSCETWVPVKIAEKIPTD